MRLDCGKVDFWTPPPGKVLSAARGAHNPTKKDQGGRVANENVCVPGFQRFGFEQKSARAVPGSEPAGRVRSAAVCEDLRRCAA